MKNTATFDIDIRQENLRLQDLHSYQILDTPPEEAFDNLVQLMAEHFHVPIVTLSLVDKERVFFKAQCGLDQSEVDREISLCAQAILTSEPLIITNMDENPCSMNSQEAVQKYGIKFYAASQLVTSRGNIIGVVSIADTKKREFSEEHVQQLNRFAKVVMHEIELRIATHQKTELLLEREAQLEEVLKVARIGTWEYDVITGDAKWSDELFSIFGLDKETTSGSLTELYNSLVHPEDSVRLASYYENLEITPTSVVIRCIRPDGQLVYVHQSSKKIKDETGRLVTIKGISQDVTEQVEYEEKLRANEERFRSLVQNSSDMIGIIDTTGNYQYVADSVQHILGYEASFFKGKNAFEFIHPDDIPAVVEQLKKVLAEKHADVPMFRFKHSNGNWVWIETKVANLIDDPAIQGLVVNSRDITQAVLLEEQLLKETTLRQKTITSAVIRAQESERSQLGQELHDNVNQVLTTIKLYNEMMAEGLGDFKDLVQKSNFHLQSCIDEIRSISKRLSAPTLGDINLEDSIKELIESINMTNRVEILYEAEGLAGLAIPQDLHLAIYRIIQEQLNNIIKYAHASLVKISLRHKGDQLYLHISDNGKGFDTNAKRTGIGITNMRTRAENLNGQFRLQSSPGEGCLVEVCFAVNRCSAEATCGV